MVDQLPPCAAQPLFEHGTGHAGMIPGQKASGVELNHFHVAQGQPGAQRHRQTVHRLVTAGRVVLVHGRSATRRHQHRFGPHKAERAGAHVDHQNTGQRRPVPRRDQPDRAMLLQFLDTARQHLLHQPVDDLDPGQITLVHGAVGRLAGKRLLMQRPIGIAVKETPNLILQFTDAHHSLLAQPPCHVLVGQPLAAMDRVHEMPLDRIATTKRHVVAALHHPRAAAFADQPLDGDGDPRAVGRGLLGVKRGKETRATGAEDQNVSVVPFDIETSHVRSP